MNLCDVLLGVGELLKMWCHCMEAILAWKRALVWYILEYVRGGNIKHYCGLIALTRKRSHYHQFTLYHLHMYRSSDSILLRHNKATKEDPFC